MKYLHEHENWTEFTWNERRVRDLLGDVRFRQGTLIGELSRVGFALSQDAEVRTLTFEVVASSEIEGVALDAAKVRSSVSRRLGVEAAGLVADTRDVDGAVDVVLDAVANRDAPLTHERLFGWHAALFPTGYSGLHKIEVARYRTGSMRVVSGSIGRERIHFEAPAAEDVFALMDDFVTWFNAPDGEDPVLKAGLAHLRFLTVHPFEDGNGRIARALTEMLLARSDGSSRRFYSMAGHIMENREGYYDAIERAQKGGRDVTGWLEWFLHAVSASIGRSADELHAAIERSAFWQQLESVALNARQRKVLSLLVGDFEDTLTARKWARICKVSPDTALRDINDLIAKDILVRNPAGGRSTSYSLADHLRENAD